MILVSQNSGFTPNAWYVNTRSEPEYLSSSWLFCVVNVTEDVIALKHGSVNVRSKDSDAVLLGKLCG